ncbi:MAG: hypothetical protein HY606_08940 [Planctomycetes bacterium]|nr:hypothetical protein [Planctomycetota bacterium]
MIKVIKRYLLTFLGVFIAAGLLIQYYTLYPKVVDTGSDAFQLHRFVLLIFSAPFILIVWIIESCVSAQGLFGLGTNLVRVYFECDIFKFRQEQIDTAIVLLTLGSLSYPILSGVLNDLVRNKKIRPWLTFFILGFHLCSYFIVQMRFSGNCILYAQNFSYNISSLAVPQIAIFLLWQALIIYACVNRRIALTLYAYFFIMVGINYLLRL